MVFDQQMMIITYNDEVLFIKVEGQKKNEQIPFKIFNWEWNFSI